MRTEPELIRKEAESALLADEHQRTCAAIAVGERTGLFAVPRIPRYDAERAFLESERIPDFVTIRELAMASDEKLYALLEQAGAALAAIHADLRQDTKAELHLPAIPHFPVFLERAEDDVFVHGDFTGDNVGWSPSRQKLFILDWSTAPMLGRTGNFGSRYFDLVWFAAFLFQLAPPRLLWRWNSEKMAKVFLGGYAAHCRYFDACCFGTLGLCLYASTTAWWKRCEWRARENRALRQRIAAPITRILMARRWHLFLSRRGGGFIRQAMVDWGHHKQEVLRTREAELRRRQAPAPQSTRSIASTS